MPICTKEELAFTPSTGNGLSDSDLVFYCQETKEVFSTYDELYNRVMLINSTIWECEITGQGDLTYLEALKSEKKARKLSTVFKEYLRALVLLVIKEAQQSTHSTLAQNVYHFIKDRYFRGEQLSTTYKKPKMYECKVLEIIPPLVVPADGIYPPNELKYKIEIIEGSHKKEIWTVSGSDLKRRRSEFTYEQLQLFIKISTVLSPAGIIVPKENVYTKYVEDQNVKFESLFIGKMQKFKPAKPKPPKVKMNGIEQRVQEKLKKQPTLSKFLVVRNEEGVEISKDSTEIERLMQKKLEAMQKIKEQQQAELERKRRDDIEKADEFCDQILRKCDDLERNDQKPLPLYKPVRTIVPSKYFGDLLHFMEFFQSFISVMPCNHNRQITFFEFCRGIKLREICGPLSDIVQLLVRTIFSLMADEEGDRRMEYILKPQRRELREDLKNAAYAHRTVEKFYSCLVRELPVDAYTITEVLRLHLLGSGATTDEIGEKMRFTNRDGYDVCEDPGLEFKRKYPHILKALRMYTFFELPISDIIKVLNCLMDQILTYEPALRLIEERHDQVAEIRRNIKEIQQKENKRNALFFLEKKKLTQESGPDNDVQQKIDELTQTNRGIEKKFTREITAMQESLLTDVIYLGSDRAYRNYYVFQCMPGVFVEHPIECYDVCMEDPPKNDYEIAFCRHTRKDLRHFFMQKVRKLEKSGVKKPASLTEEADKENCATLSNGDTQKVNGTQIPVILAPESKPELPSPYDLYMCTGNPRNCIVHDMKNDERMRWSLIDTPETLEELIESLNDFGIRESNLLAQISLLKNHIINHMRKCPTQILCGEEFDLKKIEKQMILETNKKYKDANLGFSSVTTTSEMLYAILVEEILHLEAELSSGYLGKLKVDDKKKWRDDLENNSYDPQCEKLVYGIPLPSHPLNNTNYIDPGECLGDTPDIETEDSSDEGISLHSSPTILKDVTNLASALLQVEQGIHQKFFKEPFGVKSGATVDQSDDRWDKGHKKLLFWETSLMASKSFSQIFLHKQILRDAVAWEKSGINARCTVCNRRGDAQNILLCDFCNQGTHLYCLKPKLNKVPEGFWYCKKCEEQGMKNSEDPQHKASALKSEEDTRTLRYDKRRRKENDVERANGKRAKFTPTEELRSDIDATSIDSDEVLSKLTKGVTSSSDDDSVESGYGRRSSLRISAKQSNIRSSRRRARR